MMHSFVSFLFISCTSFVYLLIFLIYLLIYLLFVYLFACLLICLFVSSSSDYAEAALVGGLAASIAGAATSPFDAAKSVVVSAPVDDLRFTGNFFSSLVSLFFDCYFFVFLRRDDFSLLGAFRSFVLVFWGFVII